jgi:hypothetical protein
MTVSVNGTTGITFNDASTQNTAATGFGFKNRIINGNMTISQRNGTSSVTPTVNGTYTLDRWTTDLSVTSKFSVQQDAGAVTPPTGFIDYLGVTSLSAYTVGASETFGVSQIIEGFNIADLGWGTASASPVTLSFWVRSSLTGTFGGSIRNEVPNRSYPYTYTISAANTWEYKTITIAGDTSGTWLTNNGWGMQIIFGLGSGSTRSGTAGAWAGSNFTNATGAVSVVGTNGATFYITGVQLEKGSTATSFDYRPYGTELALCQRYYYKQKATSVSAFFGVGTVETSTAALGICPFPVPLRTAPTSVEQTGTPSNYRVNHGSSNTVCSAVPTFDGAEIFSSRITFNVPSGLTTGQACILRSADSAAYLAWSAEL